MGCEARLGNGMVGDGQPAGTAEIPANLCKAVANGTCILFLGAGVHAPPPEGSPFDYPESERPLLARPLAERLAAATDFCKRFPENEYPEEYPLQLGRVALYGDTPAAGGRHAVVRILRECLAEGKVPSPALQALAELPFPVVITTNYDGLFESALRAAKPPKEPVVRVYDAHPDPRKATEDYPDGEPSVERPLVFKFHGDLDHDGGSIVITDDDYIRFVQRMSDRDRLYPVPPSVKYRLVRWPTLFLGYSLRDFDLRLLLRTLRWGVDTSKRQPYFAIDRGPDPLVRPVLEEKDQVVFLVTDLWRFVPRLYREILGREMSP